MSDDYSVMNTLRLVPHFGQRPIALICANHVAGGTFDGCQSCQR